MNKIRNTLKEKNLSFYDLEKLFDYSRGSLSEMIKGERPFSDKIKEKILPILEVSKEEFESWIIADKYDHKIIEKAIESFKNREDKKILILTQNIDRILKEKTLSRTALSKIIKHSQSGLNRAITGKEPLSKNVAKKLSIALEIPEEDLQAWILADKQLLKVLELALKID
ncbi:MAG TPA: hypothetical protein DDW90_07470 [Cyanobacteria bacterium UBA9971]|nr:hypothetical protein [Cyanobacteria bacterium UBA9971]